jgi:hypothetical protein
MTLRIADGSFDASRAFLAFGLPVSRASKQRERHHKEAYDPK